MHIVLLGGYNGVEMGEIVIFNAVEKTIETIISEKFKFNSYYNPS